MTTAYSTEQLIAAVQRSPERVAAHDRAGWCALFSADAEVNDPFGSRPHQGPKAIGRFYDTFIAPNDIILHVEHDLVCGMTVWRDLEVETRLSTGLNTRVPMHLRYDLVEEQGVLKIRRLFAHWELSRMMLRLAGDGLSGWWTALKLGPQMIAHQGLGGMFGFMEGYYGVGAAGKRRAAEFLHAAAEGNVDAASAHLVEKAELEWPAGKPMQRKDFIAALRGVEVGKMLAAGYSVTASLRIDGSPALALFFFDPRRGRPDTVRIYI